VGKVEVAVGGTGVPPVVSGVAPETVGGQTTIGDHPPDGDSSHLEKFGMTPNLTGVTPVPPGNAS